ncbi:MAG TPA: hypothetical protein VFY35_11210 [Burkholderiaceae bacterium]|nr:hypothetical protein [Burkholderiaceae bacterium]
MNSSVDTDAKPETMRQGAEAQMPLAREAGIPFKPSATTNVGVDPIAEWLGLMEVVQMLCPVWPVRDQPMQGDCWRL